jgi:hypothetical protein
MKAITTFTLVVLMAALAVAQTSTTKKTTTATKPTTTTKTSAAKATPSTPAKTATKPATTAQKPAPKANPMAPKTAKKSTKPTELNPPGTPTETAKKTDTGKKKEETKGGPHRDPFVSPIMARTTGGGPTACAGGKKCLPIDQLNLQGVVQTVDGMIAVVANPANRVYYLHESDPLWDGYVVKIMLDQKTQTGAVIFRQNVIDKVGQQSTRDVTKRVEAPAL